MTDLLLVNPLALQEDPMERKIMTPYFPLGLLYLAAVARNAGYSVGIFDATFKDTHQSFVDALEKYQPKVVGISALATVRQAALRIASLAKRAGCHVILGGADPTGRPDTYLLYQTDGVQPIDLVVIGEGEHTILDLLPVLLSKSASKETLSHIDGIAYRDLSGNVVKTPPRAHIENLDQLPFPARDLLNLEAYREAWISAHGYFSLSLIATRGCPFGCKWCQKSVFDRTFRARSPNNVAEELLAIKQKYNPDHIRIVDDVMGINRKWVRALHKEVLKREAVIPFECLSRVDLIDDELATLLKDMGCQRIALGAESGSQSVLDAMNKGTKVEQIYRAAEICRKHDIEAYFYIMLGYPGEKWDDIQKTAKLLYLTRPDAFSSTIAYPLPGTEFYNDVEHLLLSTPDWDYTAENRLLFQREYPTIFYTWVQRWLRAVWQYSRIIHGDDKSHIFTKTKIWLKKQIARLMVVITRYVPASSAKHISKP